MTSQESPLLSVQDLSVEFPTGEGTLHAVRRLTYSIRPAETLAMVGESGAGKSVSALAVLGLLPPCAKVRGSVSYRGTDLLALPPHDLRRVRGRHVALIPQDAIAALNPVRRIGDQIAETLRAHRPPLSRAAARSEALELLAYLDVPDALRCAQSYPHQLSGGMCRRALIALTLASHPEVILADEPTTGLDATTQRQVLECLRSAQAQTGSALVLITHDLGVVAACADRVVVVRDGSVVEQGPVDELFTRPRTGTLARLLAEAPQLSGAVRRPGPAGVPGVPVLSVRSAVKHFRTRRRRDVHAVCGVSLDVALGETVAVVGESGCGKTTLARLAAGLTAPGSGTVEFDGPSPATLPPLKQREVRARLQVLFQDAPGSLDPRMRVEDVLAEPLAVHGRARADRAARVRELLRLVGLGDEHAARHPRELSGGQQQRVALARAVALEPEFLVLDEPAAALDSGARHAIIRLLRDLRERRPVAALLVTHDLPLVEALADRVAVMYVGRLVEIGPTARVLGQPAHPYTRSLVDAVFVPDPATERARPWPRLAGDVPSASDPPSGCRFRTRCPLFAGLGDRARRQCATESPRMRWVAPAHAVACHQHA